MKSLLILLFLISVTSSYGQQQFNDLKIKNLELVNELSSSVLVTDDERKVRSSSVLETELETLSGASSNIQEQLDSKVSFDKDEEIGGVKTFTGKLKSSSTDNGNNPCPVMSQEVIDIIAEAEEGDCVFNSTTGNLNVFDGLVWKSAGGGLSVWDEGKVFNLDDVVVYEDAVYKCTEAHTSASSFDVLKWALISADSIVNDTHVKKIEADKVLQTGEHTLKIEVDKDNLLLNGSFEAQTATQGWTVTPLATATASTSDVFEGKKKVCLSGVGSIYQLLDNTDKFHGRKFIARLNVQNPNDDGGKVCLYDGVDLYKCVNTKPSDEFVEYVLSDTFIQGKTYGIIYNSNTLNGSCIDKASIKEDANEAYVAEVEGDWQEVTLSTSTYVEPTLNLGTLTKTVDKGNAQLFELGTFGIKPLRDIEIKVSYTATATNNEISSVVMFVYRNGGSGVRIGSNKYPPSNGSSYSSTSETLTVTPNDRIAFSGWSSNTTNVISIYAKARSKVVVYPEDEVTNEQVTFRFRTSAQSLENVGDFKLGNYSANTNTLTYSNSAPTSQSLSSMSSDGVRVYPRAFNLASDHTAPSRMEIKVAKPNEMASCSIEGFDPASPQDSVVLDYKLIPSAASETYTNARGLSYWSFNPKTGVLVLDAGFQTRLITNASFYKVSDGSGINSAFIKFKCSKLAQASVMRKPPRELVKVWEKEAATGVPAYLTLYSDGWHEIKTAPVPSPVTGTSNFTFYMPFRDNNYTVTRSINDLTGTSFDARLLGVSNRTTTGFSFYRVSGGFNVFHVEGYVAASYLLENFGIKVNY